MNFSSRLRYVIQCEVNFCWFSEGNVKLKMSDEASIIAQYREKVMTGYRREWNGNGTLTRVEYRYRNAPVGNCWYSLFYFLIRNTIINCAYSTTHNTSSLLWYNYLKFISKHHPFENGVSYASITVKWHIMLERTTPTALMYYCDILILFFK